MNALRRVHGSLRREGLLLDLQPEPGDSIVEVLDGDDVVATVVKDESWCTGQILRARNALEALIGEGLFVRERTVTFEFVEHAGSVDDWEAYRTQQRLSALDEGLAARLRQLTPRGERLRMREDARASILSRVRHDLAPWMAAARSPSSPAR